MGSVPEMLDLASESKMVPDTKQIAPVEIWSDTREIVYWISDKRRGNMCSSLGIMYAYQPLERPSHLLSCGSTNTKR